jgi:uncharacterized membrane protein YbhN (UPF0104 family)
VSDGRAATRARAWLVGIGFVATLVAAAGVATQVDGAVLRRAIEASVDHPVGVLAGVGAFAVAFVIRAWLWSRAVPGLSVPTAWSGIAAATGANHVLPMRLGEPLRVVVARRRSALGIETLTVSTVGLRAADVVTLGALGLVVAPGPTQRLLGTWGLGLLAMVGVVFAAACVWQVRRLARGGLRPALEALAGSTVAWCCEAVLVWQGAQWAGLDLSATEAIFVTAAAVTSQVIAIGPGGFGTYEAASTAAYVALGFAGPAGLAAALWVHALKTIVTVAMGLVALRWPAPSLVGPLRLPRSLPDDLPTAQPSTAQPPIAPPSIERPVVLVLPARNEAPRIAAVLRRVPPTACGHEVRVVVVDDGSTDDTVDIARAQGATVVQHPDGLGLGAAVRTGLRTAVALDCAAVAFCDADGEYAPEELATVVGPVLRGEAQYVVGSRFTGTIHHMRAHRRFGNVVLTRWVRWMVRRPVTDGQSGYRALSCEAAAHVEIVHDYNYAQVLTVELIGRGYGYAEVPISYSFRTSGRSFVRLGRYLTHVVPSTLRLLRRLDGRAGAVDVRCIPGSPAGVSRPLGTPDREPSTDDATLGSWAGARRPLSSSVELSGRGSQAHAKAVDVQSSTT